MQYRIIDFIILLSEYINKSNIFYYKGTYKINSLDKNETNTPGALYEEKQSLQRSSNLVHNLL